MKQIIREEFKKVFKKKSFLLLLLLLLLFSGLKTYQSYQNAFSGDKYILNDANEELRGVQALRYIDDKKHSYAGKVDNQLILKLYTDYQKKMPDINSLHLDKALMLENYGSDYQKLYDKYKAGQLRGDELNEVFQKLTNPYVDGFSTDENGYVNNMRVFYKESPYIRGLNSIYTYLRTNDYDENVFLTKDDITYRLMPFLDKEEYQIKPFNKQDNAAGISYKSVLPLDSKALIDDKIIAYYNQMFMKQEPNYDSDMGNQFLISNMSDHLLLALSLILIAILLSDMFSYDKQCKCDQIICVSKNGNYKLKGCKVLVGQFMALGIVVLQQLVIISISMLMLPSHTLQMSVLTQGIGVAMVDSFIQNYPSILISAALLIPLAALVIASITMLLSYLSKNKFISVIIMLIIILVGTYISWQATFNIPIDQFIPMHFIDFTLFHRIMIDQPYSVGIVPVTLLFDHIVEWRMLVFVFWIFSSITIGSFITFAKVGKVSNK